MYPSKKICTHFAQQHDVTYELNSISFFRKGIGFLSFSQAPANPAYNLLKKPFE
jgi:hypothetical protein